MAVVEQVSVISAQRFAEVVADGGVVVFPADTVYGIACDPDDAAATARIYELKGRRQEKPAAVMFFSVSRMLDTLDELAADARAAAVQLLPGPYTLVVANPRARFLPACAGEPQRLGLRVPLLTGDLESLGAVRVPVLQTSANISGEPDAHRLAEIDPRVIDAVDLALDGGTVGGTASTVIDLTAATGWRCLRRGSDAAYERAVSVLGTPAT